MAKFVTACSKFRVSVLVALACILILALQSGSLQAEFVDRKKAPKSRLPKKITKMNTMQPAHPAIEVPDPLDDYSFTVTGVVEGISFYEAEVPVYYFRPYRVSAGTLPVNSPLVVENIRSIAGRNFYGFTRPADVGAKSDFDRTVWIDGRFVKADFVSKK